MLLKENEQIQAGESFFQDKNVKLKKNVAENHPEEGITCTDRPDAITTSS